MRKKVMLNTYELEDAEFDTFKQLIYDETGIKLTELKKALVRARLTKRIRKLGLDSFKDYNEYLKNNYDAEKFDFINSITTNKTDFFREPRHFDYIKNVVLPELDNMKLKKIRIWSSACSSGEEPYTIGISLLEYYENKRNKPEIKILATDIDTNVLEKAKIGIYTFEQVKGIDSPLLKKYFQKGKGENEGLFRIKDSLKNIIYFRRLNLQDETYPMKGHFDIIFCRNVIIYFDKETQSRMFKRFSKYIADNGYLFIGHSENITRICDDFYLKGNTIYGKVLK